MTRRLNSQNGYVALLSILIVGAVSLAIALSLLLTGIDNQKLVLNTQESAQARNNATACAEEALQRIYDNNSYIGSGNLIFGIGSCTYTVTAGASGQIIIDTTGTIKTIVRKIKIHATIGISSITITSWQDTT